MTSQRWLVFSFFASIAACSNDAGDDACATSNLVDDDDLVSTSQSLTASEQRGVARAIDGLFGVPELDLAGRTWADAPRSAEHALVRDFVETVLIDADPGADARYKALRRVVVAGDLVLARSEGERAGASLQLYDLFRISGGRVVERWSGERTSTPGAGAERSY